MMADLLEAPLAVAARARSMPASDRPAPKAPICRKLRREMPSQKRWRLPQSVNIGRAPQSGTKVAPRTVRGGIVARKGMVIRTVVPRQSETWILGRGGNEHQALGLKPWP